MPFRNVVPKAITRSTTVWPWHIDRTTTRFVKLFFRETKEPLWFLVDQLRYTRRLYPLASALRQHGLSHNEYAAWKPAVFSPDLDAAIAVFHSQGFATTPSDAAETKPLPTWLVFQVVAQKVRTHAQAQGPLLDLVFSHLPIAPAQFQPPLLILATISLAKFGILSPLRRIVQTFLETPLSHPSFLFNTLLHAITRFPRSVEAANQVVVLLQAMEARQLRLQGSTYDALLSDRFVSVQLTKVLRARMVRERFVPTAPHLEAYLRIFAKHGAIHKAEKYLTAIRQLAIKDGADGLGAASVRRGNTMYIGAFRNDRASAFEYLSRLTDEERTKAGAATLAPRKNERLIPRFLARAHKKSIDIYDWTTALGVAARDPHTSAEMLVQLLESAKGTTTVFRPNTVTYTVVLRGLYRRGAVELGERVWRQFCEEGLVLDRKALTVGLQILTQSGQAHEAFALLEAFAVKPKMGMLRPWGAKARSAREEQCAIPMSILAMNDFMVSLIRAGRPDVVFKLWDHMDMLYGIIPDALCLNNLLDAARVAAKMDDSFSGVLGELALKNPFRRVPRTATGREEVVDSIRRILDGGRSYSSGVWNEAPAWQGAIQTFRQVIIGNWPELKHVGGPGRGAGFAGAFEQGDGLARKHVQIVPLESTFFRYIRLLGGVSMGAEIPLGLVWMRELGIGPSRRTLAIALVLWGEVGGKREYEELVRWVREWVGDEGMPNDEDMRHWVRRRD